jgi:hypothetical protein
MRHGVAPDASKNANINQGDDEMSKKVWDLQDLKGQSVLVSESFKKNGLTWRQLHPTIDSGYKLHAVVSWNTGSVRMTAVHGIGGAMEEFRGEELRVPSTFSNGADQEEGLSTLRLVQAYLDRFEPEFEDSVKETVKQALLVGRYGASDSAEDIQRKALSAMREAVGG